MSYSYLIDPLKTYQLWGDVWSRGGWRVQVHARSGDWRLVDKSGKVLSAAGVQHCLAEARAKAPEIKSHEAVILLHSMAGDPRLLSRLAGQLEAKGYEVANVAYSSLDHDLATHIERVNGIVAGLAESGVTRINFVGHSLGGLIARGVAISMPVACGRIVFLGTPNRGSRLGQILQNLPPYKAFFGPSGRDVLAAKIADMPIPNVPMLVIAGGNGRFGFNPLLPGDDDGIVTVQETRFADAPHDFLRVLCLHRDLPRHKGAMKAAIEFIAKDKT